MMTNDSVCRICDGGPANGCNCTCGFEKWTRVSEAMVTQALNATVPGGSPVYTWLPMCDAWTSDPVARDVMRSALSAVLDTNKCTTTHPHRSEWFDAMTLGAVVGFIITVFVLVAQRL